MSLLQKLSGFAKTFRSALLTCWRGFCDSVCIAFHGRHFHFHSIQYKWPCSLQFQQLTEASCTRWRKYLKFPRWPKSTIIIMMQRKNTIATNATSLVLHLPSWKPICEFTAERSPLFAQSATILAQELKTLESTCKLIQEKSLIVANSATILARELAALESTSEPTQEQSLITANSVTTPAQRQAISRSTCSLIQGKNYFIAPSVPIPAQQVLT